MRGLFHGLTPTLLAVVPFIAIQNATIDILKEQTMSLGERYTACGFIHNRECI
jgi:hypothetical protein